MVWKSLKSSNFHHIWIKKCVLYYSSIVKKVDLYTNYLTKNSPFVSWLFAICLYNSDAFWCSSSLVWKKRPSLWLHFSLSFFILFGNLLRNKIKTRTYEVAPNPIKNLILVSSLSSHIFFCPKASKISLSVQLVKPKFSNKYWYLNIFSVEHCLIYSSPARCSNWKKKHKKKHRWILEISIKAQWGKISF